MMGYLQSTDNYIDVIDDKFTHKGYTILTEDNIKYFSDKINAKYFNGHTTDYFAKSNHSHTFMSLIDIPQGNGCLVNNNGKLSWTTNIYNYQIVENKDDIKYIDGALVYIKSEDKHYKVKNNTLIPFFNDLSLSNNNLIEIIFVNKNENKLIINPVLFNEIIIDDGGSLVII